MPLIHERLEEEDIDWTRVSSMPQSIERMRIIHFMHPYGMNTFAYRDGSGFDIKFNRTYKESAIFDLGGFLTMVRDLNDAYDLIEKERDDPGALREQITGIRLIAKNPLSTHKPKRKKERLKISLSDLDLKF